MINANHEELTRDALDVMERTRDPRLREILVSLVRHLHAFVRDVRLTESDSATRPPL
jgi:catechol 1,2-dioxygenase